MVVSVLLQTYNAYFYLLHTSRTWNQDLLQRMYSIQTETRYRYLSLRRRCTFTGREEAKLFYESWCHQRGEYFMLQSVIGPSMPMPLSFTLRQCMGHSWAPWTTSVQHARWMNTPFSLTQKCRQRNVEHKLQCGVVVHHTSTTQLTRSWAWMKEPGYGLSTEILIDELKSPTASEKEQSKAMY